MITLAAARDETLRLLRAAADGSLERERAARTEALAAAPALTFGEMIDQYIENLSRNAKSWKLIASNLRRAEMQPLHARPAAAVTKRELVAVIDALAKEKPQAAANLTRQVKMLLSYGSGRDLIPVHVLANVRPPVRGNERDRVLNDDELGRVWRACDDLPQPWRAMIRMLMLTGCRRNEIARMSHHEIEGDTLVIPAARMKMGRPHAVPLVPAALEVLAPLRTPGATGFVFSNDGGETAASNFAKVKAKLDEISGVRCYVLHDLRRTCRTTLAAMGVPAAVARKILAHEDSKIDRIYSRYSYDTERRDALQAWTNHVFYAAGDLKDVEHP